MKGALLTSATLSLLLLFLLHPPTEVQTQEHHHHDADNDQLDQSGEQHRGSMHMMHLQPNPMDQQYHHHQPAAANNEQHNTTPNPRIMHSNEIAEVLDNQYNQQSPQNLQNSQHQNQQQQQVSQVQHQQLSTQSQQQQQQQQPQVNQHQDSMNAQKMYQMYGMDEEKRQSFPPTNHQIAQQHQQHLHHQQQQQQKQQQQQQQVSLAQMVTPIPRQVQLPVQVSQQQQQPNQAQSSSSSTQQPSSQSQQQQIHQQQQQVPMQMAPQHSALTTPSPPISPQAQMHPSNSVIHYQAAVVTPSPVSDIHVIQQQQQQQPPAMREVIQPQAAMSQPPPIGNGGGSSSSYSSAVSSYHHQHSNQPLYLNHNPFIEILRPFSYADDNIVTLNLSHSHIYEIDSEAFVGQRFEHIDLSNNKLGLIHSRSFRIGPNHSRHNPYNPNSNSSKLAMPNVVYPTRRPPPTHPKSVTIDFSHNPAIVALSGAFDHIDVPNCLLNFTNSTVELKFGAFKKYFKEHPGHIVDIESVDCCEQEWLLGYKHNFLSKTHCEHDPNLFLAKVPQQAIIDSCIAYVTSARHSMTIQGPSIIHQVAAAPRSHSNAHADNQYLTYLILGGTAMILTSLSIYIIFYMFSLKAAFVYQMQNKS